ncbi:RDD family protein [Pseudoxanthomonas dokdonensis]|uniref:RDD family protein n=1 Tax=Pseudoxanthomonas dokdonensis TaxID=344882 RepID=A0A0R0CJA2_9GAMM|nr:RDD family protein [Pseudoxanthomonas dokdonensis]KRG69350.1 hypothetical protein ABB29_09615 [Pseudoxanthomonas dokdonensis]
MSLWYYVDARGQQNGPLDGGELASAFQLRQLLADTLVWRDGMAEWLPLQQCLHELDLSSPPSAQAIASAEVASEPGSPYAPPLSSAVSQPLVISGDVVMAGFWRRFAAASIDGLLMSALMLAVVLVALLVIGGSAALRPQALESMRAGMLGVFLLTFYVLPIILQFAYFSWMQAGPRQATLGKMAVGIKVCRSDGQAMTLGRSIGRWSAYFFLNLASCGITSLVSAFSAGLSTRKQGVHDMIVDTLVVDKWAFSPHPERQQRSLDKVTIAMIALCVLMALGYIGLIIAAATLSSFR